MRALGTSLPDTLLFRTQAVGSDAAIPDLVGEDTENVQHLIVEAKFWAGLLTKETREAGHLTGPS
jgi:hypothetical protein